MFFKVTKSGPRSYVQLVEAFRDKAGRPKQRTVATLGRSDAMGESVKSVHEGLSRLLGFDSAEALCNRADLSGFLEPISSRNSGSGC
jgi:hypothetical protein